MKKGILLMALMVPLFVSGEEPDPEKSEPVKITYFVKSDARVTKNLVFIFDCSYSMGEDDRFNKAIGEIRTIIEQPLDEGKFSMFGFQGNNDFFIWPGIPEKGCPKNWAFLPSLEAVKSANKYLNGVSCGSWTNIFPAIQKAFTDNAAKEKLTIILFSDGNNTYPNWQGEKPRNVVKKIKTLQKKRVKQGKDEILIFVFGVGVNQNVRMLSGIAKAGRGSYLTMENVCQKCVNHKEERADMQKLHEAKHDSDDSDDSDSDE
jgi:Mg-chelatase subunit ChlD